MKGVPVKFRGKTISDGRLVYGDYVSFNGRCAICVEVKDLISFRYLSPYIFDVDPDSVAQLVGYDAKGNEIYEDDKLILGSHEYIAGIRPVSYTDDKKYYMPEKDFSNFLLKDV